MGTLHANDASVKVERLAAYPDNNGSDMKIHEICNEEMTGGASRTASRKWVTYNTKALRFCRRALLNGESDDDLLSHGRTTLSSALFRFTALFGMGRGGTRTLWSSDITVSPFGDSQKKQGKIGGSWLPAFTLPEL